MKDDIKLPPLPEWSKMDDLGGLVPSEIRQALAMYAHEAIKADRQRRSEPVAWLPYLTDRADGVTGHYAIARKNPAGYREVWNLRHHRWAAFSDEVLNMDEALAILKKLEMPTAPQPAEQKPAPKLLKALKALEVCRDELRWMIDKQNQQNQNDGSWLYDYQTVEEANAAIVCVAAEIGRGME